MLLFVFLSSPAMIFYSTETKVVDLRRDAFRMCPKCAKIQVFHDALQYRCIALYYVFGVTEQKKYMSICQVCNYRIDLKKDEIQPSLERLPIPFLDRFGCLSLLVTIGLTVLVIVMTVRR